MSHTYILYVLMQKNLIKYIIYCLITINLLKFHYNMLCILAKNYIKLNQPYFFLKSIYKNNLKISLIFTFIGYDIISRACNSVDRVSDSDSDGRRFKSFLARYS